MFNKLYTLNDFLIILSYTMALHHSSVYIQKTKITQMSMKQHIVK